jgi:hypothetical protein
MLSRSMRCVSKRSSAPAVLRIGWIVAIVVAILSGDRAGIAGSNRALVAQPARRRQRVDVCRISGPSRYRQQA